MNTLEQMRSDTAANLGDLTMGAAIEMIKSINPSVYNSIIIDEATALKRYDYYYIHAESSQLEYKTERRSAAVNDDLAGRIEALLAKKGEAPYIALDNSLIEQMEKAPKYSVDSFFSDARKRMSEKINGGRGIKHADITLNVDNNRPAKNQPAYAVIDECFLQTCPTCNGEKYVEQKNKEGIIEHVECSSCKGLGRIALLTYFVTKVSYDQATIIRCKNGNIDDLKTSVLEAHKGDDTSMSRMLTHFNGTDIEEFDEYISPLLDIVRDKIGKGNATEDIYYHLIPCYTFSYRDVISSEMRMGVIVDPFRKPELVLNLGGSSFFSSMKDSAKGIGNFFGRLSKSDKYKDREDLIRSTRLMIAIAVADGHIDAGEKQALTLSIRNIDKLTDSDRNELVELLGSVDSSFLTDDDFNFHSMDNAKETLVRMQEIAAADGEISDVERDLIERLNLKL